MKKVIVSCMLLVLGLVAFSQSASKIKSNSIQSKNIWVNKSATDKYLESTEKYDVNGNLLEEIKYEEDKTIKSHKVWTYNANNDKLTETELDKDGNILKKTVYEYNGVLKISKKEYNEKNKLVEWKTYTYESK
ncbi:MAG: hypothetical protein HC906_10730 [Bacteroidales bacterium]|nr:hypothetical protein [Bacteroidales bacterium]